jgi:hypothetical protein
MKDRHELVLLAAALSLGCGGETFEGPGDGSGVYGGPRVEAGTSDARSGRSIADGGSRNGGGEASDIRPPGVLTLATMQEPGAIALDAENVYWTNSFNLGDFTVRKVPISGGPATILASHQAAGPLAVDASYVYFAVLFPDNTYGLRKVPLAGGVPITLAPGSGRVTAVAVDATNLYWSDVDCGGAPALGSIRKLPLAGGPVTTLASGQNSPAGIAVDGTSVYWADQGTFSCPSPQTACGDGAVRKVAIAGGSPMTLAAGGMPLAIAVDATSAYWLDGWAPVVGAATGSVRKVSTEGGAITTLASLNDAYVSLALNATSVYWIDRESNRAVIKKVPTAGGVVQTLGFAGDDFLGAFAVDSMSVYFGNGGVCGPEAPDMTSTCDGVLRRLTPN